MEELRWNFRGPKHLWVKMMDSERELTINGTILSNNNVFIAESASIDKYHFLSSKEKVDLKERLSYLTRSDKVRIIFDH